MGRVHCYSQNHHLRLLSPIDNNPDYKKIDVVPFNVWCRSEIGRELELNQIDSIDKVVDDMLKSSKDYNKKITDITNEYVYNLGTSSEKGAEYIIKCIQDKVSERSKKK